MTLTNKVHEALTGAGQDKTITEKVALVTPQESIPSPDDIGTDAQSAEVNSQLPYQKVSYTRIFKNGLLSSALAAPSYIAHQHTPLAFGVMFAVGAGMTLYDEVKEKTTSLRDAYLGALLWGGFGAVLSSQTPELEHVAYS
ncbi:MAG: hypothetical protein ACMXYE_04555, partial [Candidatus Woesearchaeota archaeon]